MNLLISLLKKYQKYVNPFWLAIAATFTLLVSRIKNLTYCSLSSNIAVVNLQFIFKMIDTHAHLMLPEFNEDREDVINRAFDAGLSRILNLGCSIPTSTASDEFSDKYENIYGSLGVHPYDAVEVTDELMDAYAKSFKANEKLVTVGETGLDFHREGSLIEPQKQALIKHFELARQLDLPVIIHSREAKEATLEVLDLFPGLRGVVHCFSYDLDYAKELWQRGIMTSFTGIITYPNAQELVKVLAEAPKHMVMTETDSPYLAPQKHRGKRNEPAFVAEVVAKIAEIWEKPFDEVVDITTKNTLNFFNRMK